MAPNKINVKERVTDDKIDLSMSDLGDVPVRDIATFRKATSLDLSDNRLVVLPKNFPTLTHITTLDLSKNELKELPENFGDLVKLRHLDLYRNQIQYLPISFSKLTNLRWLDLKDNPLVPAVAKIAGPCLDAKQCLDCAKNVVNFFIELQKQVEEERNKLKQQQKKEVDDMPQQIKHESKKNKKKAKEQKKSISDNYSTNNVQIEPKVKSKQHKKKDRNANQQNKNQKKSYSSLFSIFKWLMLIFLIVFILTSTRCKCTQPLLIFVQENYRRAINYLPENLKIYGVQLGDNFGYVHMKTGQLTNDGIEYVLSKDWKQIYDKIYNFVLLKSNE